MELIQLTEAEARMGFTEEQWHPFQIYCHCNNITMVRSREFEQIKLAHIQGYNTGRSRLRDILARALEVW